jgi:hypothetical protein
MSVLARFGKRVAILRAGSWISSDGALETRLNDYTTRWFQESGGPPLSERNQEAAVAAHVAREMGGRLGVRVRAASKASNRYFLAKRQMALSFDAPPLRITGRARFTGKGS